MRVPSDTIGLSLDGSRPLGRDTRSHLSMIELNTGYLDFEKLDDEVVAIAEDFQAFGIETDLTSRSGSSASVTTSSSTPTFRGSDSNGEKNNDLHLNLRSEAMAAAARRPEMEPHPSFNVKRGVRNEGRTDQIAWDVLTYFWAWARCLVAGNTRFRASTLSLRHGVEAVGDTVGVGPLPHDLTVVVDPQD